MQDPAEIARFYDRCSDRMRELLDALAAAPDRPRPFPQIEDAMGWPRRRIASVLGLVVVPALVSYWRGTKRMQAAARVAGQEPRNGWIALILFLVISLGLWGYMQSELNGLWRAEAEALPGQPAPPEIGDSLPPRLPGERAPAGPQ